MAAPAPSKGSMDAKSTFKVLKSLGAGSYGKVYKVQRTNDEQSYALKETDMASLSQDQRNDAVNEVRLLVSIKHPNVIGYHEAFLNGSKLCVVMEYAPFGDLRYYITKATKQKTQFPEEAIWRIFLQLAKGLSGLHGANIVHRDIKPANIFLCANDLLKIGDLGIAKALTHSQFTRTSIGTPIYMAPEVWAERPYSYSSDMWSVGCVLYEMMTLSVPFTGASIPELSMRIRSGRYKPVPAGSYSPELIGFCHTLLSLDPKKRPSANEILSHAACANWLRVLPSGPPRRQSENGAPQGLARMRGPSCSGAGLLDTILVPRDLKQLPKVLPPPSYDTDMDAKLSPSAAGRPPTPTNPARAMQQRQVPIPAPPQQPQPAAARPAAGVQLPRVAGASPAGGQNPLLHHKPPAHRLSEPGVPYPSRPHSAVAQPRPAALPPLQPVRVSADGQNFHAQLRAPSPPLVPVPPRRVSYS